MEEGKKILVVDDSALMRRILGDIIQSDKRFVVQAKAKDGLEALELLKSNTFDAVVLDINMPNMNGLELLRELRRLHIAARVMVASTLTFEGAEITFDCLDAGAIDFIHKPEMIFDCKGQRFIDEFLRTLYSVSISRLDSERIYQRSMPISAYFHNKRTEEIRQEKETYKKKHLRKIVAISCSTGGPKALQEILPMLPKHFDAPIVVIQHMPEGYTQSLAMRLNSLCQLIVKEAEEGETLKNGVVYISKGGNHLTVCTNEDQDFVFQYMDGPFREGVKPCANYLYESLADINADLIVGVVLTGMGTDGTEGIKTLKASNKNTFVINQSQDSCVVYGMPKSIQNAGLSDLVLDLKDISRELSIQIEGK